MEKFAEFSAGRQDDRHRQPRAWARCARCATSVGAGSSTAKLRRGRPRDQSSTSTSTTCTRTRRRPTATHGSRWGSRRGAHRRRRDARRRRAAGHASAAPATRSRSGSTTRATERIDKPVFGLAIDTRSKASTLRASNSRDGEVVPPIGSTARGHVDLHVAARCSLHRARTTSAPRSSDYSADAHVRLPAARSIRFDVERRPPRESGGVVCARRALARRRCSDAQGLGDGRRTQ